MKNSKYFITILVLIAALAACRGPLSKPGSSQSSSPEGMEGHSATTPGKAVIEKQNITIDKTEGITTIAELYSDLKKFDGKTIVVKGKVTKVNPAIMNRNWVHIQDGTESNGQFDLTITTDEEFELNSVITVEGKIALDKDFGYGYTYAVLLENGKSK